MLADIRECYAEDDAKNFMCTQPPYETGTITFLFW